MSKTDHGTIDVLVGENTYTLAFTLKAVKRIERVFTGILPAMQEVQKFSLHAAMQVIAAGADLVLKPKDAEALEEDIYNTGVISVTPLLVEYLSALLNPAAKTAEQLEENASAEPAKAAKK